MTAERRIRFLTRLDEALRPITDPDELTAAASRLLSEHLGVDRCAYAEVEGDADHLVVTGDYTRGDTASIRGRHAMSAFGAEALRLSRAGRPYVVDDVATDPRVTSADRAAYERTQIRAVISVPLLKAGRFVAGMAVHQRTARQWAPEEVDLVVAVAQRCWESIERARALRTLRASEERLLSIFTRAAVGVVQLDLDGRFELVNEHFAGIVGRPTRELLGARMLDVTHPDDRGESADAMRRVADGGGSAVVETRLLRPDGSFVWARCSVSAVLAPDGRPRYLVAIVQDVTAARRDQEEREHLLVEAELARGEAEEANRAKSQFLATMSHELRTPINAVIGYTELLELGIAGPVTAQQAAQLGRIRSSSQHLVGLVDDILDLAKIEAGQMRIEHQRVSVPDVVESALALVRPQAEARGLVIVVDCDDDELRFVGDPDRARQILLNLLSNATKFTPRGTITLQCGSADRAESAVGNGEPGSWTYLRVSDTGVGIAPEHREAVFQPFMQASSGHTRQSGGTGLGLSISRHLARLMGGDLTLRSEPGVGSEFTLWLPASEVDPVQDALALLVQSRRAGATPTGLREVGERVRPEVDEIVRRYVRRLRDDPEISMARPLGVADLEDHLSSILMDVIQTLIVLGGREELPERLLRDGSEIQRTLAALHGEQRARLGWSEEAFRREAEIVQEEVEAAVLRTSGGVPEPDVEAALGLLLGALSRLAEIGMRRMKFTRTLLPG